MVTHDYGVSTNIRNTLSHQFHQASNIMDTVLEFDYMYLIIRQAAPQANARSSILSSDFIFQIIQI